MQALHLVEIHGGCDSNDNDKEDSPNKSSSSSPSSITITTPISSAIHVTKCTDCNIQIRNEVQQLRIHESSNVEFQLKHSLLGGGAILEDSTDIQFIVVLNNATNTTEVDDDPKEGKSTTLLDVNDFNWLRDNVPSPNYQVITRIEGIEQKNNDSSSPLETTLNAEDETPSAITTKEDPSEEEEKPRQRHDDANRPPPPPPPPPQSTSSSGDVNGITSSNIDDDNVEEERDEKDEDEYDSDDEL